MSSFTSVNDVRGVLANISFTSMAVELPGDGQCGCAVHRATVINDVNQGGCAGWDCGSMPAIRMLYGKHPMHACLAEPGVRALDVKCARTALSGVRLAAFAGGNFKPVAKYVGGTAKAVSFFGAGYCYQDFILPEARVRAARILGPMAYMVDVLRLMCVFGTTEVRQGKFEKVAGRGWHWCVTGEALEPAWVRASEMAEIVREDPEARMGATEEEHVALDQEARNVGYLAPVAKCVFHQSLGLPRDACFTVLPPALGVGLSEAFVGWLTERGWVPPAVARPDLQLIVAHPAQQAAMLSNGRDRVKTWAMLGDAVLRTFACAAGVASSATAEACNRKLRVCDNAELARSAGTSGFGVHVAASGGVSTKVMADAVEALLGLMAAHSGTEVVLNVYVRDFFTYPRLGAQE